MLRAGCVYPAFRITGSCGAFAFRLSVPMVEVAGTAPASNCSIAGRISTMPRRLREALGVGNTFTLIVALDYLLEKQ